MNVGEYPGTPQSDWINFRNGGAYNDMPLGASVVLKENQMGIRNLGSSGSRGSIGEGKARWSIPLYMVYLACAFSIRVVFAEDSPTVERSAAKTSDYTAIDFGDAINVYAISKDSRHVLVGTGSTVRFIELTSTARQLALYRLPPSTTVKSLALHPNGTEAAVGRSDKYMTVIGLGDGREIASLRHVPNETLRYSEDGDKVILGGANPFGLLGILGNENVLEIWDIRKKHRLFSVDVDVRSSIGQSPVVIAIQAPIAAILTKDKLITVFNVDKMEKVATMTMPQKVHFILAISANAKLMAVGFVRPAGAFKVNVSVGIYRTNDWKLLHELPVSQACLAAACVSFSHDDKRVAIPVDDQLHIFDVATGRIERSFKVQVSRFAHIHATSFLPDNNGAVAIAGSKLVYWKWQP